MGLLCVIFHWGERDGAAVYGFSPGKGVGLLCFFVFVVFCVCFFSLGKGVRLLCVCFFFDWGKGWGCYVCVCFFSLGKGVGLLCVRFFHCGKGQGC